MREALDVRGRARTPRLHLLRTPSGRLVEYPDEETLEAWVASGRVRGDYELFEPETGGWHRIDAVLGRLTAK